MSLRKERQRDEVQRQRLVILLRVILVILMSVVIAVGIVRESEEQQGSITLLDSWWILALMGALFFSMVVAVDILTPQKKLSAVSAILFGIFGGLVVTVLLSYVIDYFKGVYFGSPEFDRDFVNQIALLIKVILGLSLSYLGASTILQTQDDFRLVIPYVEFAKQIRGPKPLVIDTSALIDGRIHSIADIGMVQVPLIIPRFVLDELQALSDSDSKLKRSRGRRGLDIVGKIQKSPHLDVTMDESLMSGNDVDQMLVEYALSVRGVIVTTDTGLARIASIRGVHALNLHELARAMRPSVIPGEPITVHLIKAGEQAGQAVGYLEDGTMVVAEDGGDHIGTQVRLVVKSTMQTSAGQLVFGRLVNDAAGDSGAFTPEADEA